MTRRAITRFSVWAAAVVLAASVVTTPLSRPAMAASLFNLSTGPSTLGGTPVSYTLGYVRQSTFTSDTQVASNPLPAGGATPTFTVAPFSPVIVTSPPSQWLPNSATSSWIGANTTGTAAGSPLAGTGNQYQLPGFLDSTSSPQGYYYFTTTFSLGSGQFAGSGVWTSDNQGLEILLNGNIVPTGSYTGFNVLTNTFTLPGADFVTGTNSLTFITWNEQYPPAHGSPAGLRVEGSITAVPEPSSVALIASSLPVLGLFWARRPAALPSEI